VLGSRGGFVTDAFFAMNEFNGAAFEAAVKITNDLVTELAPR
jgi:D-alanyl-D-alanine-carboxypeptidase/D-alanyl-D-alanine-endopeptidase